MVPGALLYFFDFEAKSSILSNSGDIFKFVVYMANLY